MKILNQHTEIPKFVPMESGFKYVFTYWLGLFPFLKVHEDVSSNPYMTRDFMRMKLVDGREKSFLFYCYIGVVMFANYTCNMLFKNLN